MRRPDILGVVAALVVGVLLTVLLLASAVAAPPALPSPVPPSISPLPTPTAAARPSTLPTPVAPGQTQGQLVAIGQPASPLQVTLTDGSLLDIADYAGLPMWINFMATWTPQSAIELPLMDRYQKAFEGHLMIVVVDVGEDRQTVTQFMNQLNIDVLVGVDEDAVAQRAWGAYALPVHLFIDADGVVQEVIYGGEPVEVWDQAIMVVVPDFVPPTEE